jgi:glycosyltransferase involved in cell wall biosynthesis
MIESPPRSEPQVDTDAGELRAWAAGSRVQIVHDWLLGMRGGERVLESLLRLFPRAGVSTLFYDPRGVSEEINRRSIRPSGLSGWPMVRKYYRGLLPLMPGAAEKLEVPAGTELVISTSHCVAHGVRVPAGVPHVTYCFSPMRYLYDQRESYARGGSGASAAMLRLIEGRLRAWDAAAARRCGRYFCISKHVADRIQRTYGLEAEVIYPPVRTDFFTPEEGAGSQADQPFLVVSALTGYKRVDVAIEAANRLKKALVIAGTGPLEGRLRRMAGPTVRFLGWVSDEMLRELYRTCSALIFPGEEDFGIVPLEAMACGCPVLALRAGALKETHIEGETGEFFEAPDADSLAQSWGKFEPKNYAIEGLRKNTERFGEERFRAEFARRLRIKSSRE